MSADEHLSGAQFAYQTGHRPGTPDYGTSMDNPEMMYPDYHKMPHVYRTYSSDPSVDRDSHAAMQRSHGNPEAKVQVFRSGPTNQINPGDWVTPSKAYAQWHKESNGQPDWNVASRTVKAGHLFSEGNSIAEWGWHPQ